MNESTTKTTRQFTACASLAPIERTIRVGAHTRWPKALRSGSMIPTELGGKLVG